MHDGAAGPHLQVMQRVGLEHAEEGLLPLLKAKLRMLRESAVDVAADHLPTPGA